MIKLSNWVVFTTFQDSFHEDWSIRHWVLPAHFHSFIIYCFYALFFLWILWDSLSPNFSLKSLWNTLKNLISTTLFVRVHFCWEARRGLSTSCSGKLNYRLSTVCSCANQIITCLTYFLGIISVLKILSI